MIFAMLLLQQFSSDFNQTSYKESIIIGAWYRLLLFLAICQKSQKLWHFEIFLKLKLFWHFEIFLNTGPEPYGAGNSKCSFSHNGAHPNFTLSSVQASIAHGPLVFQYHNFWQTLGKACVLSIPPHEECSLAVPNKSLISMMNLEDK